MPPSMQEPPLARSLIGYAFWKELRRLMPPKEFEEYVTYWKSRFGTESRFRAFESELERLRPPGGTSIRSPRDRPS